MLVWSQAALDETAVRFAEDASSLRLSDFCAAPADGTEGTIPQSPGDSLALLDVVILFTHGDTSPEVVWPEEKPAVWDCTPQALPRYWKRNERLQFKVFGGNATRLD